jgi:hypothetical protein
MLYNVDCGRSHCNRVISRLVFLDHAMEIKTGMVFALETWCPAADGFSVAASKKRPWPPTRAAK